MSSPPARDGLSPRCIARQARRRILLVSHQEDFAEAFSDGYQFKLENGATRVTRHQK